MCNRIHRAKCKIVFGRWQAALLMRGSLKHWHFFLAYNCPFIHPPRPSPPSTSTFRLSTCTACTPPTVQVLGVILAHPPPPSPPTVACLLTCPYLVAQARGIILTHLGRHFPPRPPHHQSDPYQGGAVAQAVHILQSGKTHLACLEAQRKILEHVSAPMSLSACNREEGALSLACCVSISDAPGLILTFTNVSKLCIFLLLCSHCLPLLAGPSPQCSSAPAPVRAR